MSKRVLDGKPFTIAVSVLIAVVLWFYVLNVENPTGQSHLYDVPVVTVGENTLEDRGLILTDLSRDSVDVDLSGYRKTFLEVFRTDVSVSVDVSGIDEAGEYKLTGKLVPTNLNKQENLSLTEEENFLVIVTVEESKTVEIPTRSAFVGTLADEHAVENITISPETLLVTGPADVVDSIAYGLAEVSGEKVAQSFAVETAITLITEDGEVVENEHLSLSFDKVEACVSVAEVFTLDMAVKIIPGGGATEKETSVLYKPEEILVTGDREVFEKMGTLILGEIALQDVFVTKTEEFPLDLPHGLTVFGEDEVENVAVTVSISDLSLGQLEATNIKFEHVPRGYTAVADSKNLMVWLRGKEDALAGIKPEDVLVTVDMSEATVSLDEQMLSATVTMNKETEVGIVGREYSLKVTLVEDNR